MPIYTYECSRGHRFEVWQGIHDEPLDMCEELRRPGGKNNCLMGVRRIIVAPGGFIMEPTGIFQMAPGKDRNGRQNEVKITRREHERQDRQQRAAMLEVSKRGPRLELEAKKTNLWH